MYLTANHPKLQIDNKFVSKYHFSSYFHVYKTLQESRDVQQIYIFHYNCTEKLQTTYQKYKAIHINAATYPRWNSLIVQTSHPTLDINSNCINPWKEHIIQGWRSHLDQNPNHTAYLSSRSRSGSHTIQHWYYTATRWHNELLNKLRLKNFKTIIIASPNNTPWHKQRYLNATIPNQESWHEPQTSAFLNKKNPHCKETK